MLIGASAWCRNAPSFSCRGARCVRTKKVLVNWGAANKHRIVPVVRTWDARSELVLALFLGHGFTGHDRV